MPKIDAPSVAEHRAAVRAKLIDAAEALMREGEPLTATAVSAGAGIARNSIYRYVESVDDLRGLVASRHLPAWMAAVTAESEGRAPADRVVAWVAANLRQWTTTGHGWLMAAARAGESSSALDAAADRAHADVREPVVAAWRELLGGDAVPAEVATALTVAVLDAGFALLERDVAADVVVDMCADAARALTERWATPAR